MRYRDHMNLGTLVYIPFLSKAYVGNLPKCLTTLFPFFKVFFFGHSWVAGAAIYFFFSIGCCLPDIDMAWYPDGGHRTRSPFHNLTNILILYAISVFLCAIPAGNKFFIISAMISALLSGCLVHLAGDFIQGGIGWGIIFKRKIGFQGFRWDIYANTMKGLSLSAVITIAAFAAWWWMLNYHPSVVGYANYSVISSFFIWLYSIAMCRSYSRYLANAGAAAFIFAIIAALRPSAALF